MTHTFLFNLIASFCVGATFVTAATLIADKYGTTIGGIIASFPSTVLVALLFIGASNGADAAAEATLVVPMILGFTGVFLLIYAVIGQDRHHFINAMVALSVWVLLSAMTLVWAPATIAASLLVAAVLFAFVFLVFRWGLKIPSAKGEKIKVTVAIVAARALFGGTIIMLAVLMARVSGPLLGGVMTGFPALSLSTLLIAGNARGLVFARSLAEPMFFGGVINTTAYAVSAYYFYPSLGLVNGTLACVAMALVCATITYQLARRMIA